MVLIGRFPLELAPATPDAESGIVDRYCESGVERTLDCACGVWVSESSGEDTSWLSPSLSADIVIR